MTYNKEIYEFYVCLFSFTVLLKRCDLNFKDQRKNNDFSSSIAKTHILSKKNVVIRLVLDIT